MVSTTTPYPPHPLTVGAAPAIIWGTLIVLRLAMPVIMFAVGLPMLAQRHDDPVFLSTALVVAVPVLIVWMIISNRLRAELKLRVPGAMRSYSWSSRCSGTSCPVSLRPPRPRGSFPHRTRSPGCSLPFLC